MCSLLCINRFPSLRERIQVLLMTVLGTNMLLTVLGTIYKEVTCIAWNLVQFGAVNLDFVLQCIGLCSCCEFGSVWCCVLLSILLCIAVYWTLFVSVIFPV